MAVLITKNPIGVIAGKPHFEAYVVCCATRHACRVEPEERALSGPSFIFSQIVFLILILILGFGEYNILTALTQPRNRVLSSREPISEDDSRLSARRANVPFDTSSAVNAKNVENLVFDLL
jgi:hypothetical protein